jgi:CRP-like cAMP-binding protein
MKYFLKTVAIFKELPEREIERIQAMVSVRDYVSEQVVFNENERGKTIFIVKSGSFSLFMGGQKMADFHTGDVFGELALINDNLRSGKVVANEEGTLFEIKGADLTDPEKIEPTSSLKIIRVLARQVTSYLKTQNLTRTEDLIHLGESDRVEFKSSLRYNRFSKKFGREIEHTALKSIAAFLNSKGGTLFIGVADNGDIPGLGDDQFENDDKALLHLTMLINERIGSNLNQFVKAGIEEINGKKLMRVDVQPSTLPAYLRNNNEEYLFVRTGPATNELKPSEIFLYVFNRFFSELVRQDKIQ